MLTYQNIKNNNVRSIDCKIYRDEYWDFMLYKGETYGDADINKCLISDFSNLNIEDGILYSDVVWEDAVNNGTLMEDIGFTGPDNGLIRFERDRISNYDFLKILTGSTYDIPSGDTRFFFTPVTGNTQQFSYPMFLEENETEKYLALKGGFYQGFYKLFGFDYQTLPNGPDVEWNLHFVLRPRTDYEIGGDTINALHPENKGIFFYMGTRAENKFANLYKMDSATTEELKIKSIKNDGYLDPSICGESGETLDLENHVVFDEYLRDIVPEESDPCDDNHIDPEYYDDKGTNDCNKCKKPKPKKKYKPYIPKDGCECNITSIPDYDWHISSLYEYKYEENSYCCQGKNKCKEPLGPCNCDDDHINSEYYDDQCYNGPKSIEDTYLMEDATINENQIADTFGHLITKKGYYEIESDNKFLMFDRTPEGFTVKDWIEGTKVTLTGRQDWSNINYFPIMNRTCTGYTTKNIYKYQEENTIPYNIYKDIKNNSFGLRITDDGAIGYKYAVLDCDADNDQHYTVKEEYSKPGLIKPDVWNYITVKISIINPSFNGICDPKKGKRKMKLYFYVNGFLVFVTKELDEFNFRELNDTYQKQEAVPYNMSLGGGTQGLLESILPDYYKTNDYVFPIEKDFCGSFIGDIKTFKIYNCQLNYLNIKNKLSN